MKQIIVNSITKNVNSNTLCQLRTELGFDDSTLGKYSKAIMTPSKGKESSFIERLKVSPYQIADPKEPSILIDNDVIEGDRENGANVQSRDD